MRNKNGIIIFLCKFAAVLGGVEEREEILQIYIIFLRKVYNEEATFFM